MPCPERRNDAGDRIGGFQAAMRHLHSPLCTLEPQVVAHAEDIFLVWSDPAIYEYEGQPPPSVERLADG